MFVFFCITRLDFKFRFTIEFILTLTSNDTCASIEAIVYPHHPQGLDQSTFGLVKFWMVAARMAVFGRIMVMKMFMFYRSGGFVIERRLCGTDRYMWIELRIDLLRSLLLRWPTLWGINGLLERYNLSFSK
jgi:hypothetical protein